MLQAWQEEKETYKNMCGQLIELKWDDNQWYSGFLVPRVLLDEEHARMPDMEYGVLYEDGDSDLVRLEWLGAKVIAQWCCEL